MAMSSLTRWSRSASILGAVLLIVQLALSLALGPAQDTSNPFEIHNLLLYVVYNLLFGVALLLFVVGLLGLHARRAEPFGWHGRAGFLLTLGAGVLAVDSLIVTFVVGMWPGVWPELLVPLAFFTQLLAVFCLISGLGFLGMVNVRAAVLGRWISGVRWRWVLLILAIGLGAALLSEALETIMMRDIPGLNMKGTHVLHVLITVPAAIWVARQVGTAPVLYGVLVGLVSGIINQIYFHSLDGTLRISEAVTILVLSTGAGWLGGVIARSTLAEQETLYRTSRAIGAMSSLQDIVNAIGEHLADPQVSHVALWRDVSETEGDAPTEMSLLSVWMPRAARVWGHEAWRPGLRLDATQVPTLARLKQQSPLVLRTRKLPASERAVWEHQGIRSAILLPLIAPNDARVGLLMVASRRAFGFSRVKVRTYVTIGAQVALALENSRLVEQAQQAGVSWERKRLAHEIRDTLAQGFTSIVMNLEAAKGTLPPNSTTTQQYLARARHTARDGLAEARRLVWALTPEPLEHASLPEALARLAERWSEEAGTAASATVTGAPHPLTPEIEVTLLRAAQEALANCRKHARASQVAITLSYMENLVRLKVQDNGVGFDPAQLPTNPSGQSKGGFGLKGMRERVEQLRGTLLVESAPGVGSTLMVTIPVAAVGQPAEGAKAVR